METANKLAIECLGELYGMIRQNLIKIGYTEEIKWQQMRDFDGLSEQEFLIQYCWVVLSSGMRESVIRSKFNEVKNAFGSFSSVEDVLENSTKYATKAKTYFNHDKKINSIIKTAKIIECFGGFVKFKKRVASSGLELIQCLPYMGPATSLHLAKNIGIDVAKPDRHLVKLSRMAGYSSVSDMCSKISKYIGEEQAVVDLVLWRYATLQPSYDVWQKAIGKC